MAKDFRKISLNRLHWYNAADNVATLLLHRRQRELAGPFEQTWRHLHGPALYALGQMERWGAVPSIENVKRYDAVLAEKIEASQAELERLDPKLREFNPKSPKQMCDLLYRQLGLPVIKRTSTRQPSTDAETLQKLVADKWGVEFNQANGAIVTAPEVLEQRKREHVELRVVLAVMDLADARNQRSKYGLGYLKHVGYDGRVHTTYRVIRTGRLSSKDPNLQNLTSPDDDLDGAEDPGVWARQIYIPPPGWVIVSLDYSQIELRVAALLSGDDVMAGAFEAGTDFHTATACKVFGKQPADVSKGERRVAKTINFGVAYGLTHIGLAKRLGITEEKAQEYIDAWLGVYRKFAAWRRAQINAGYRTGMVWAQYGLWTHKRAVPEMGEAGDTRAIQGLRKHGENVCVNTPIQNVANCFCLSAMANLVAWIKESRTPAELNLNVHDALVMYVRQDAWREVAVRARQIMTQQDTGMVRLKVDVELGEVDYGHLQKVTDL